MAWFDMPNGGGAMLPDNIYGGNGAAVGAIPPSPQQGYQYGLPPEVLAQMGVNDNSTPPLPPLIAARTDTPIGGMFDQPPEALQHEDTHGLPPAVYQRIASGKPAQLGEMEPDYAGPGASPTYQGLPPEVLAQAQQRPMPQVDAISGVDGGALPAVRRVGPPPIGSAQDAIEAMDQAGNAQQRQYQIQGDEADTVSGIKDKALADAERQRAEAAQAQAAHQAEMQRNYQQLSTAIDARNSMTVDPGRKWASMGTGSKILAGIGVALSGIGQALSGHGNDPNLGLKVIHDAVKDDVDDQMRQREMGTQTIEGVKQKIGAYDDLMKTDAGQRAALMADGLESAAQQIEVAAAKFTSPMLKAKAQEAAAQLRLAKNQYVAQGAAAQAGYNLKVAEVNQKAIQEAQKQANEERKQKEEERKNAADEGLRGWAIASENKRAENAINAENFRAMLKQGQDELASGGGITAPVQMTDEKGQPVTDNNGIAIVSDGKLRNKKGDIWLPPKEGALAELSKRFVGGLAAARTYNSVTNEMIRGIAAHGGESDYYKSDDWQNMKALQQAAIAELHDAYGVTSFRESTAEYFEKAATAGVDPTSFVYNASQALRKSNEILQGRVNDMATTLNYNGPKIKFQDTSMPPEPTETPVDEANRQTSTGGGRATGEYPGGDVGHVLAASTPMGIYTGLKDTIDYLAGPRSSDDVNTGITNLQNLLASPDERVRNQATTVIQNLLDSPDISQEVKQKAGALLTQQALSTAPVSR